MVEDTILTILDNALSKTYISCIPSLPNFYKLFFSCYIVEFIRHFKNCENITICVKLEDGNLDYFARFSILGIIREP